MKPVIIITIAFVLLIPIPIFAQEEVSQDQEKEDIVADIPNYIAIPISIAGGFAIAIVVKKYFPSSTEIHLAENQRVLLLETVGPLENALTVLNQALSIHENYDDHRNVRMQFSLHEEDKYELDKISNDFTRYRDQLLKINSNSVGEVFYSSLMKFFDNGFFLIVQGYVEYKFFIRTCQGLKVLVSYLEKLDPDLFSKYFQLTSYGEVVDLNEF